MEVKKIHSSTVKSGGTGDNLRDQATVHRQSKLRNQNVVMKKQAKQAFTLIELLTVIAIIGILASILIPTVGRVRESARRTVDSNNIRQIGQASLIYANDNRERLPGGPINQNGEIQPTGARNDIPNINALAAALARSGGLNDASIWISQSDTNGEIRPNLSVVLDRQGQNLVINPDFNQSAVSFAYLANLTTSMPSTQPIAFTRGLQTNGQWANNPISVYRNDGGHVVFIGGNVNFFRDVGQQPAQGRLIASNGQRTNNVLMTQTAASGVLIFARPNAPVGQTGGQSTTGPAS